MSWVTVWLITSIYVALAVAVFSKLVQAANNLALNAEQVVMNKMWRAPLSALSLSALLVFGFNFMSCITLIKKSINRGGPGFGYGFMMAFSFSLSFFLLLCGLVLDGFRPQVQLILECKNCTSGSNSTSIFDGVKSWSKYSSEAFVAAEVFSLICFVTYLLFAILLVVLQAAVSEHLGIEPHNGKYAAAGAGAAAIVTTVPAGLEPKDGVAPPEYDQNAYYEQYGGYAEDGHYEQTGYQAPSGYVEPNTDAGGGGYYTDGTGAGDYQATPDYNAQGGVSAAPLYANTGFAAINQFGTVPAGTDTGLISNAPNNQAAYTYGGNQQV